MARSIEAPAPKRSVLTDSMGGAERINKTVFPSTYRLILHFIIYLFVIILAISLKGISLSAVIDKLKLPNPVFLILRNIYKEPPLAAIALAVNPQTKIRMPACREWLIKQWANVHRLKHDRVSVIGFTWYSLLHQVDWDSALRHDAGTINGLNRKIMPVGEAYKQLNMQWKDVISEESFGLIFHNW